MQPHLYRAMCLKTSTLFNLSEIFSQLPSHPPPRRAICHLSTIAVMPYTFLNPSLFFPFLITVSSPLFSSLFHSELFAHLTHRQSNGFISIQDSQSYCKHKVGEVQIFLLVVVASCMQESCSESLFFFYYVINVFMVI